MDRDTEAHAVRDKMLRPPACGVAVAPWSKLALLQGAAVRAGQPQPVGKHGETKGTTAVYYPLSCGLCSKEGNCSGRNLCFHVFLFVCLFETSSHFPEKVLSDIPKETWRCFLTPSFALHISSFLFCFSFLLFCVFLLISVLPLSCAHALKNFLYLFFNFVLDMMIFSRSAPVLNQIPLCGHVCQSLVTYRHFGVPVRRGGRGAEVAA